MVKYKEGAVRPQSAHITQILRRKYMKYTLQQKLKCNEDIARIKEMLPDYAGAYIDAVAAKTDSSFRTGRAYAYELLLFFDYIKNVKKNPA